MKMLRTKRFLAFMLVVFCPWSTLAHETDQYSVPSGREFADLGPYFTGALREALDEGVDTLNAQIRGSLRHGQPTTATARFYKPRTVADSCYHALPLWFSWVEAVESRLKAPERRRQFPGLITVHQPSSWIYDHWALVIDPTKLPRQVRCGTVMVDGVYFGTDKLMHFAHVGFQYHDTYRRALADGASEAEATRRAIALGCGANPFFSEGTWLGLLTTGVWSNADLAVNYVGLLFFRNLTETVEIHGEVCPPLLVRDGVYWRVAGRVAGDDAMFSRFVSDHWDEVLNPSWYPEIIEKCVRQSIAERCDDTVAWYRVRRRALHTSRDFIDQVAKLQNYHGVDYGARGEPGELASIATTCDNWDSAESLDSEIPNEQEDAWGRTALWWAAYEGNDEDVRLALANGDDPNQSDIDGESPLQAAVRRGSVEIVEQLLSAGADANHRARYGVTPLHLAARERNTQIVALLLKSGADPKLVDAFGKPALERVKSANDTVYVARLAPQSSRHAMARPASFEARPTRVLSTGSKEKVSATSPRETEVLMTTPVESPRLETTPLETMPLEAMPVETMPLETMPLETMPIDTLQPEPDTESLASLAKTIPSADASVQVITMKPCDTESP